jgi:ketopantoate reductase
MTTAIIGVGNIGGTVARQLASGGEPVLFSATSSDKVQKLAGEIGTPATAALDNRDAVQRADAVILALSLDPMKVVIDEVADLLPGKLVIDPSNPIAIAAEGTVSRTLPDGQSAGGVVASWLTQAPRYRRLVATRALAQLQFPPDWAVRELADALREACHDPQIRILVDQAVDQALAGSIAAAATAMAVLATWEQDGGGFAMTARQRLERLLGELDPRQRRCLAPLAWVYPDGPLRALATASDPNRKTREHTLASLVRVHLRTAGVDAETTKPGSTVLFARRGFWAPRARGSSRDGQTGAVSGRARHTWAWDRAAMGAPAGPGRRLPPAEQAGRGDDRGGWGQVGNGTQRNRSSARRNSRAHGQRVGRCRCHRRAERVSRPGRSR